MPPNIDPIEGNWYEFVDDGRSFFIVTIDEDEGVIEIQDSHGDIEEIELEAWPELDLEPIDPPEDWLGPLTDIESDDLDYEVHEMDSSDWSEPLDDLEE